LKITKTDPFRIRIHSDRHIRKIKPLGSVITGFRESKDENDWLVTFKFNDTKPYHPELETTMKENLDKVLEQFDVRQDHIRERLPYKIMNSTDLKKSTEIDMIIDEKRFAKQDNKYDLLIDKMEINRVYPNGKKQGRIKDFKVGNK
jgi:hypothetical protein